MMFRPKSTLSLIYTRESSSKKNLKAVPPRARYGSFTDAGVAQLVEHFLAKEDVGRSSRLTRFCPLVPRGRGRAKISARRGSTQLQQQDRAGFGPLRGGGSR